MTKIDPADARANGVKFRARRKFSRSHGSSVRKLIRAHRIEAGLRPLDTSRRFTMASFLGLPADTFAHIPGAEGTFARLHPTKGFRFGNAI